VTNGNRAPVWIDDFDREIELIDRSQDNSGKCFVDLVEIDVGRFQSLLRQQTLRSVPRLAVQRPVRACGICPIDDASEWLLIDQVRKGRASNNRKRCAVG
jgi:hypothetical protein